jgi:hypothetical protein
MIEADAVVLLFLRTKKGFIVHSEQLLAGARVQGCCGPKKVPTVLPTAR